MDGLPAIETVTPDVRLSWTFVPAGVRFLHLPPGKTPRVCLSRNAPPRRLLVVPVHSLLARLELTSADAAATWVDNGLVVSADDVATFVPDAALSEAGQWLRRLLAERQEPVGPRSRLSTLAV